MCIGTNTIDPDDTHQNKDLAINSITFYACMGNIVCEK